MEFGAVWCGCGGGADWGSLCFSWFGVQCVLRVAKLNCVVRVGNNLI